MSNTVKIYKQELTLSNTQLFLLVNIFSPPTCFPHSVCFHLISASQTGMSPEYLSQFSGFKNLILPFLTINYYHLLSMPKLEVILLTPSS